MFQPAWNPGGVGVRRWRLDGRQEVDSPSRGVVSVPAELLVQAYLQARELAAELVVAAPGSVAIRHVTRRSPAHPRQREASLSWDDCFSSVKHPARRAPPAADPADRRGRGRRSARAQDFECTVHGLMEPSVAVSSGADYGQLVESEVRRVGATLGAPDFVYLPAVVKKGSATREVGDGFLIAGDLGAMLQVKTRDPAAASGDTPADALVRIERMLRDAIRQADGSRREVVRRCRVGDPPSVLPYRALALPVERRTKYLLQLGPEVAAWPVVVVVDHPLAVGVDLGFHEDALAITLSDWRELQKALSSTTGVLTYLTRVLEAGAGVHVPLGHEEARFNEVARADEAWAGQGGSRLRPWLAAPVGPAAGRLFNELIEHVWEDDGDIPWQNAEDYRRIVAAIDSVPPSTRAELAGWVLGKRRALRQTGARASGAWFADHQKLFVYACDALDRYSTTKDFTIWLGSLTLARRGAVAEQTGTWVPAVGIGALVRSDPPGVAYSYSYIDGEVAPLPQDARWAIERDVGRLDLERRRTVRIKPGRNDQCPCGSGTKFKRCCGR